MYTFHQISFSFFISILLLVFGLPKQISGQNLSGKWKQKGSSKVFHFSSEGVLKIDSEGLGLVYAFYFMEDNLIGFSFFNEENTFEGYEIKKQDNKSLILAPYLGGSDLLFDYQGAHEISQDYINYVLEIVGKEDTNLSDNYEEENDWISSDSDEVSYTENPDIIGTWRWTGNNNAGYTTFKEDGSWFAKFSNNNDAIEKGTYILEGNKLVQTFSNGFQYTYEIQNNVGYYFNLVSLVDEGLAWQYYFDEGGQIEPEYSEVQENDKEAQKEEIIEKTSQSYPVSSPTNSSTTPRPASLSLVGCWEDESGIGDPYIFDQNGFFKYTSDDPSYDYGYVGTYTFDGQTLTVRVYEGGGMTMTVGQTYTYPIENLSSTGMNMNMGKSYDGSYYKPRYRKTSRFSITQKDKNKVQAAMNFDKLKNTKWSGDGKDYLFLDPNYLILRQNGQSYTQYWLFDGNTLWAKNSSGSDQEYHKIGAINSWTPNAITLNSPNGRKILQSGRNVATLNTNEKTAYISYLKMYHAIKYQSLIGIGQGMGYYDVDWNY